MSSFFVELWESVFTPGPTPSILKATNASFAALQVTLFLLLLATRSIHCIILSVLCAGLWWSINWFATELYAVQAREREEAARLKEKEGDRHQQPSDGDEETETEVESAAPPIKTAPAPASAAAPAPGAPAVAGLEPLDPRGEVTHRPGPGTQSSASTEDEWEKVSENENDKDK
ncbi:SMK killer toxin resistance protein [Neonectria magnoliae]|uniref:SMK killer toxin resistance protein n=1 Tax=Neonectria magnoliae TaxID=2732573 RepID=A0ABR1I2B7_9HYPO